MKIIIAGSRHMPFELFPIIQQAVDKSGFDVTEVVCGEALGADTWGKKWAFMQKPRIPVKSFPADWNEHGKRAGPIRNKEMGDYADGLIVFIWPNSRGSQHMLNYMQHLGKPVFPVFNGEIDYAF